MNKARETEQKKMVLNPMRSGWFPIVDPRACESLRNGNNAKTRNYLFLIDTLKSNPGEAFFDAIFDPQNLKGQRKSIEKFRIDFSKNTIERIR